METIEMIYDYDDDYVDEPPPPHCYICYNMNMSLIVKCACCSKKYCKSHSWGYLSTDTKLTCSLECHQTNLGEEILSKK